MATVRSCPHCHRLAIKDDACNFVVCGRTARGFAFVNGEALGCGRPWCFQCGKKLCGRMYNPDTGETEDLNEDHNHPPGTVCDGRGYCPGGHDAHKQIRRSAPHPVMMG